MLHRAALRAAAIGAACLSTGAISSISCSFADPAPSTTATATTSNNIKNNKGMVEKSRFLDVKSASAIRNLVGTPVYVYDEKSLIAQANQATNFPNSYGLTVRFAMKACPNAAIIQIFHRRGIHFDASSGYEVERAIKAGVPPSHISLSSQELPHNFEALIKLGIHFNACSLHQLEKFGQLFPNSSCGVRFNPGQGSGGTNYKTVRET